MPEFINHNGTIFQNNEAILMADNRGYRYGYGLFETMKVITGKIILEELHFERLFSGLALLKFELSQVPSAIKLREQILELCKKNDCEQLARIRLSFYGGNGSPSGENEKSAFIIESRPLDKEVLNLSKDGLLVDIYPDARKSCDVFSNLKSANYLPYLMAAKYAQEKKLDEALMLNSYERLCDSSIANIFLVKGNTILTPPLSEGCVNGTIRKYLISKIQGNQSSKYTIHEQPLKISDLEYADEVFLTNAVSGIRRVKQFRNKTYTNIAAAFLHNQFISSLYS